ncbi:Lytic transglycosylase [Burkholderiales bacterium]|nr:Lytic transglycosylase [Burkholderiales bacterium]
MRRRRLAALGLLLPIWPRPCWGGAQQYETLADSVRGALAAQIADRVPPIRRFDTEEAREAYQRWLAQMSTRLVSRVPEMRNRTDLLQCLDYECTRAGLDRQLVLGLIQVESNFRKYAISDAGARGLMQVMPFWTELIGDGNVRRLFEMRTNLRYGCVILRHYVDGERGDLFRALGRYNGSVGQAAYPNAVLAAWKGDWNFPEGARRSG